MPRNRNVQRQLFAHADSAGHPAQVSQWETQYRNRERAEDIRDGRSITRDARGRIRDARMEFCESLGSGGKKACFGKIPVALKNKAKSFGIRLTTGKVGNRKRKSEKTLRKQVKNAEKRR